MANEADLVTYSIDELKDFRRVLDEFFAGQPDEEFELKIDARLNGWTAHFKLPNRLPSVTPNLLDVARFTNPGFVGQLVDQLIVEMENRW
jgi:hypothetical protein